MRNLIAKIWNYIRHNKFETRLLGSVDWYLAILVWAISLFGVVCIFAATASANVGMGDTLLETARRFGLNSVEDLLVSIGDGSTALGTAVNRVREEFFHNIGEVNDAEAEAKANQAGEIAQAKAKKKENAFGKSSNGIAVRGVDNVMVRLSRCCNPLPGDPIVGYITRGRGVSVHRLDCPNARHHIDDEESRIVEVAWDAELIGSFTAEIQVVSRDRNRLTSDILTAVADMKVPIHYIHSRATKNGLAQTNMKVEIKNLDHLQFMIDKISRIKDVQEVRRITPGRDKGGRGKAVKA